MGGGLRPQRTGTQALAHKLKAMERANADLRKQILGIGLRVDAVADQLIVGSGRSIVIDGGDLYVIDGDGNTIAALGGFVGGAGLALYRSDGTLAFETVAGFVGIYDRGGNYVVTDDATSGQGLARPYIPLGAFTSAAPPTDTTTSGSFVTLQTTVGYKQHPRVWMQILAQSSAAGTTGEVRVIDQSANVVGGVQTVAGGSFSYLDIGPAPVVGTPMLAISLNIQARVTAGTGTIGVRGVTAWGIESGAG